MVPIGYLYKTVEPGPEWLKAPQVADIYSVSGCISADFADFIQYWRHNGYWLFDRPQIIEDIAVSEKIDLSGMTLFYYEAYEYTFDKKTGKWSALTANPAFRTDVQTPGRKHLHGFDVVEFSLHSDPGCSPLSCNSLAKGLPVNRHCLFDSFEAAKNALEHGLFEHAEPGPYGIVEVYTISGGKR